MSTRDDSGVGRARVPILVGLVGAFVLMAVAVFVASTMGGGAQKATPSASVVPSAVRSVVSTGSRPPEVALPCADLNDPAIGVDEVLVYFTCEPPPADPRRVVRVGQGLLVLAGDGVDLRFGPRSAVMPSP